jgi:hypothetical protein
MDTSSELHPPIKRKICRTLYMCVVELRRIFSAKCGSIVYYCTDYRARNNSETSPVCALRSFSVDIHHLSNCVIQRLAEIVEDMWLSKDNTKWTT